MTPAERVVFLLRRTHRRGLLLGAGRVALSCLAAVLAVAAAGGLVVAAVPGGARPWVALVFLAGAAAGGGLAAVREWRRALPRRSDAELTALLAGAEPALAELLLTGSDLARWGEEGVSLRRASGHLVSAQVELASAAAAGLDPARAVPWGPFRGRAARAAVAGLAFAAALAAAPSGFGAYARLLTGGPPAPVAVGNLRLVYQPPAYTGLPERRVEGSDGAVEGYPGTRVVLEGEVSEAVDAGRWRGPDGAEIALSVEGRRFSVAWILGAAGEYELGFQRRGRAVPSGLPPRPIALLEDRRPAVEMDRPEGDLEVTTDQEVAVAFRANDDFRVEKVELVLQGDEEVRVPVRVSPAGELRGEARFLPLAYPKLGAGAHLRVEGWDGDSVRGPKPGSSRSIYVTFLDKRRLVAEIADLEARLLEALLGQLADHLELPAPGPADLERLREKGRDLLRLFEQLVERVRRGADEEALGAAAALKMEEGLRAALEPFLEGGDDRAGLIAELERDILFLDRLLQSLRMEEALSMGDELAALQRSLFDELEAGASPEQLLDRVDQLQQLLSQMAQKLSKGASEMPDSFANADAVRDMPANELQETLRELREALEKGDRERAQELAEKLVDMLSRWLSALEEAAGKASREELDPMAEELSELEEEVRELSAEQEKLLGETRALGREVAERTAPELRRAMETLAQREERRLQRIEEATRRMEAAVPRGGFHGQPPPGGGGGPPPSPSEALALMEARQRVGAASGEVREGLKSDLGRARQGAEALGEAVEALRERVEQNLGPEDERRPGVEGEARAARQEVAELLADLEGLSQGRQSGMTPEEAKALEGMGGRQKGLGERTGSVADRLQGLGGRNPLLSPGLPQKARSAQQGMGEAGSRLGQGDPFGAVPPETRALEDLAEVGRQLQEAQRQMSQGQGDRPGEGQGLRTVRKPGQRPGEGRDVDRSPVEIPRETEARELRAFREEVLRAMRSGRYPKDYEEEVERYYERLIR